MVGATSGSITLQEPAVAGTTTINLPASSGTAMVSPQALTIPNTTGTVMVSGNMPAFSAYLDSTQTFSAGTFTKVQCGVEEFDTASAYDNATNYRFTPQVAGYYQVSGSINLNSTIANTECLVTIYKNGTRLKWGSYITRAATSQDAGSTASALIYLNGSSDYVELYGYGNGSGTFTFIANQERTFFQAVLVRAA